MQGAQYQLAQQKYQQDLIRYQQAVQHSNAQYQQDLAKYQQDLAKYNQYQQELQQYNQKLQTYRQTQLQPSQPPQPAGTANIYDSKTLLCLVNKARGEHGLRPLSADPKLDFTAREHVIDLGHRGEMSHTGSDGSTAADRAGRNGWYTARWASLAEMLLWDKVTHWLYSETG